MSNSDFFSNLSCVFEVKLQFSEYLGYFRSFFPYGHFSDVRVLSVETSGSCCANEELNQVSVLEASLSRDLRRLLLTEEWAFPKEKREQKTNKQTKMHPQMFHISSCSLTDVVKETLQHAVPNVCFSSGSVYYG